MKSALCLFSLFAASAWAEEADDRAAIGKVISALNEVPLRGSLFTADADGFSDLERLLKVSQRAVRTQLSLPAPAVVISKEPWGEATLIPFAATSELMNPRISSGSVRFVTPDVARKWLACISKTRTHRRPRCCLF